MKYVRGIAVVCIVVALAAGGVFSQPFPQDTTKPDERLVAFAGRLRLGLSLASFAVYAPSLADLHLHAQQLVNLIEGAQGRHYVRPANPEEPGPGLRSEIVDLGGWFREASVEPEVKRRLAAAIENIVAYVEMARDAALAGLKWRRLDKAAEEMMKAYAYLAAANERPAEGPSLPGLWTILRLRGLVDAKPGS